MRRRCLIPFLILAAACGTDPVRVADLTCPALGQLQLAAERIAVSALHGPIRLSTLAGTSEKQLILGNVNAQDWSPEGTRLVFVDDRGNFDYALSVTDTLGSHQQLPVPLSSTWPAWSSDDWIYFFTQATVPAQIYRIRPNGGSLSAPLVVGRFPAPAPDGQRFAYNAGDKISIFDLQTRTSRDVTPANGAISLRWSPDGSHIAYIENGRITLVTSDGTTKRSIGPGDVGGISWSSDSCFLLAGTQFGSMSIISATDGAFLSLPVSGLYPAWKP